MNGVVDLNHCYNATYEHARSELCHPNAASAGSNV